MKSKLIPREKFSILNIQHGAENVQEEDNSSEEADSQVPSPSQEECIKGGRLKILEGLIMKATCRLQRKSPKEFNKTHIARRSHSRVLYFFLPICQTLIRTGFLDEHSMMTSRCHPKKTCCCSNDSSMGYILLTLRLYIVKLQQSSLD